MSIVSGAGYWGPAFGITDFATFQERVEKYLPVVQIFGIGPSTEDITRDAWTFPLSGLGGIAAGVLAIQGAQPAQTQVWDAFAAQIAAATRESRSSRA